MLVGGFGVFVARRGWRVIADERSISSHRIPFLPSSSSSSSSPSPSNVPIKQTNFQTNAIMEREVLEPHPMTAASVSLIVNNTDITNNGIPLEMIKIFRLRFGGRSDFAKLTDGKEKEDAGCRKELLFTSICMDRDAYQLGHTASLAVFLTRVFDSSYYG